jgi:hypothetical protein
MTSDTRRFAHPALAAALTVVVGGAVVSGCTARATTTSSATSAATASITPETPGRSALVAFDSCANLLANLLAGLRSALKTADNNNPLPLGAMRAAGPASLPSPYDVAPAYENLLLAGDHALVARAGRRPHLWTVTMSGLAANDLATLAPVAWLPF